MFVFLDPHKINGQQNEKRKEIRQTIKDQMRERDYKRTMRNVNK